MLAADLLNLAQRLENQALRNAQLGPVALAHVADVVRDLAARARHLEGAVVRVAPAELPPNVVRLDDARARRAARSRPLPGAA